MHTPILGATVPDMVCAEGKVVEVTPGSLGVEQYANTTVYRFQEGKLFLKTGPEPEYLYHQVTEVEPNRFVAGHKIIYLSNASSAKPMANITHVYQDEVRVLAVACRRGR